MAKKITAILLLVAVLGLIGWGIYAMVQPKVAESHISEPGSVLHQ